MNTTTASTLSADKLQDLANDPDNLVLTYAESEPLPEEKKLCASQVQAIITELTQRTDEDFEEWKQDKDLTTITRDTFKKYIGTYRKKLRQEQKYEDFLHTHPKIFATCSNITLHGRIPILSSMVSILEKKEADPDLAAFDECHDMLRERHAHLVPDDVKEEMKQQLAS
jgi:hypothetical protein